MQPTDIDSFLHSITADGLPIAIYGASHIAEVAFIALAERAIYPDVAFDRKVDKKDPLFTYFFGTPLRGLQDLYEGTRDIHILNTTTRSHHLVAQSLHDAGFKHIHDVLPLLGAVDLEKYAGTVPFQGPDDHPYHNKRPDLNSGPFLHEKAFSYAQDMLYYRYMVNDFTDHDSYHIPGLLVMLGEKCTLRCRDCCADTQYYPRPRVFDYQKTIASIDKLLSLVDILPIITISGDEPLLYSQLDRLLRYFFAQKKVLRVLVSTNCTKMPSDSLWQTIKDCHVTLSMSNYGALAKNRNVMTEQCNRDGLKYYDISTHEYKWLDTGGFSHRGYSVSELEARFSDCSMRGGCVLAEDTLYPCFRAISLDKFGIMTPASDERIPLISGYLSDEEIKERLTKMTNWRFENPIPYTVCNYCNSLNRNYAPSLTQAAVQIRGTLPLDFKDTDEWKSSLLPPSGDLEVISGQ